MAVERGATGPALPQRGRWAGWAHGQRPPLAPLQAQVQVQVQVCAEGGQSKASHRCFAFHSLVTFFPENLHLAKWKVWDRELVWGWGSCDCPGLPPLPLNSHFNVTWTRLDGFCWARPHLAPGRPALPRPHPVGAQAQVVWHVTWSLAQWRRLFSFTYFLFLEISLLTWI